MEIFTTNYAIESFNFPNDELNKFKKTENLEEVLIKFGIKSSPELKDKTGFYVPVKIMFFSNGFSNIIVSITDSDSSNIFYYWSFQIYVYYDSNMCYPIIKEQQW